MPLTRSITAPRSCLRCQLGQIVFQTRWSPLSLCFIQRNNEHARALCTSVPRCQGTEKGEDGAFLKSNNRDDKKRAIYHREYPLGRVVGQPGRRQRESSETLKIDSMSQPFDVILMQDIHEAKEEKASTSEEVVQKRSDTSATSPAQLASELLMEQEAPNQDEVDESIDTLRPTASIVDRQQYNNLSRALYNGYNTQQLSSYLMKPSKRSAFTGDDGLVVYEDSVRRKENGERSSWRPGRTPIGERHDAGPVVKKRELVSNKNRIVERILRKTWNLTIHSEEQEIGELELILQNWQMRYLFDLHRDNKPMYERVIQPPLLLRNSEVLPYRPRNLVRLTARRRDAEEIAGLIRTELREVGKLDLDLSTFKPMLGKPQWPRSLGKILPKSDLDHVGQRTASVIERKDEKTVCIYNRSETARHHGKRLLLSLLDLPSPGSVEVLDVRASYNDGEGPVNGRETMFLPESAGSNLHFRYRNVPLSWLTTPSNRSLTDSRSPVDLGLQSKDQEDQNRTMLAAHVADEMAKMERLKPSQTSERPGLPELSVFAKIDAFNGGNASYWEVMPHHDVLPWEGQFCRILQASDSAQDVHATHKPIYPRKKLSSHKRLVSTVQPEIPGINTLLSYFSPNDQSVYAFDNSPDLPHLVAHFFPSPFTAGGVDAMRSLPRLEFWYDFITRQNTTQSADSRDLKLSYVRAILYQEELRIPLPGEASDICMVRISPLIGKLDKVLEDQEIMRFTETLRQSAFNGSGALACQPAIKIKLPHWVAQRKGLNMLEPASREDVEVEYFFERFEQVQNAVFVPIQPDRFAGSVDLAMKQVLDGLRGPLSLEYKVVESGVIWGSKGKLNLKYDEGTAPKALESDRSDYQFSGLMKQMNLRLVEAALGLTTCLTRINTGDLRAWRPPTLPDE